MLPLEALTRRSPAAVPTQVSPLEFFDHGAPRELAQAQVTGAGPDVGMARDVLDGDVAAPALEVQRAGALELDAAEPGRDMALAQLAFSVEVRELARPAHLRAGGQLDRHIGQPPSRCGSQERSFGAFRSRWPPANSTRVPSVHVGVALVARAHVHDDGVASHLDVNGAHAGTSIVALIGPVVPKDGH